MNQINRNDVIFARVTQRGATIYDGRMSGLSSMSDVMAHLRNALGGAVGLMTLNLRNGSQGWAHQTHFRCGMI